MDRLNKPPREGVKIAIRNLQKKIPVSRRKIKTAVIRTLQAEKINKDVQLNLFFVSDRKISDLNLKYSGRFYPTDVLCFDISCLRGELLADIFISADSAKRNAKIFNTSLSYEIRLYVVHALLHLIGYNDKTGSLRKQMKERETRILKKLFPCYTHAKSR